MYGKLFSIWDSICLHKTAETYEQERQEKCESRYTVWDAYLKIMIEKMLQEHEVKR